MADLVLDLSNNNANGRPNFRMLRANGVVGVMLKVSEGQTFVDSFFKDWAKRARAAGMRVGGYHFAQPRPGNAKAEAAHFARNLGKVERRDFRPALDLESNPGGLSGNALEQWSREFNQEVQRLTGHLPMFYASTGWINSMNFNVPIGAALWLAHWSNDGRPFTPNPPHPWKKVHLHQYTSHGWVQGISTRVDKNQILKLRPLLAHPNLGLL